jgi:hypothetical protein
VHFSADPPGIGNSCLNHTTGVAGDHAEQMIIMTQTLIYFDSNPQIRHKPFVKT